HQRERGHVGVVVGGELELTAPRLRAWDTSQPVAVQAAVSRRAVGQGEGEGESRYRLTGSVDDLDFDPGRLRGKLLGHLLQHIAERYDLLDRPCRRQRYLTVQAELLRMQRALERLVQCAEVAVDSEVREQLDEPALELRGGGQVAHPTDGRSGGELTGVGRPRSAALGNEPIVPSRTQSQHACVKNADSVSVRQDDLRAWVRGSGTVPCGRWQPG